MPDQPPPPASLWTRVRGFLARLFRGAPPQPGRFESGSKFSWRGWIGVAPWMWPSRDYLVYVPRGYSRWRRRPMLVLLHGCKQTAQEFAAGTRIARFADERGWLVLLPCQSKRANGWGCWNWFDGRTVEGRGEAAIVAAQVHAVRRLYRAHPRQIFVAGMSAGACLGAILALRHTKLFIAAGLHSGAPCGAAFNAATALQAMSSGPQHDVGAIALEARSHASARALPVCLIHGDRDRVVAERNATELLRQFVIFNGRSTPNGEDLPDADARTVTQLPNGRTVTREDYTVDHRIVARSIRVSSLGHAWSGGDDAFAYNDREPPDATALFGEFFMAQLERRRLRAIRGAPEPIGEE